MINPKQPALEDNVLLRFEAPKVTLKWYPSSIFTLYVTLLPLLFPVVPPSYLYISRYHRGFFFFILGIISFFLSETVSGRRSLSQGYDNIYLMYPVYFFHLVVLSWLVLKVTDGRPTLPILFVAGWYPSHLSCSPLTFVQDQFLECLKHILQRKYGCQIGIQNSSTT